MRLFTHLSTFIDVFLTKRYIVNIIATQLNYVRITLPRKSNQNGLQMQYYTRIRREMHSKTVFITLYLKIDSA